jgi:hypothetical protein
MYAYNKTLDVKKSLETPTTCAHLRNLQRACHATQMPLYPKMRSKQQQHAIICGVAKKML